MKFLSQEDISNKKVIVRCDFNVPIKDGIIEDDTRIVKSLKTIMYLLDKNNSIILLSHLGRVKSKEDKLKNTLEPVSKRLEELLNTHVTFIDNPASMEVITTCKNLNSREIVLLENTRFCDYPEKLESANDLNIAKYWASLGDVFVLDAFGSMHRNHSSVSGIANFLPTYYGFLVEEEVKGLDKVINVTDRPFGVFMGGAKVDDKLGYIEGILPKCDYLLVGGGIANSFLYACGYDVKNSLRTKDEDILNKLRELIKDYKDKIILPVDFVFDEDMILDLGVKSVSKYINILSKCKTIFINGTLGKFEDQKFAKGTIDLFKTLENIDAYKVAGGGDTLNAINEYNLSNSFNFLSSGGGASLEYVSDGKLSAIDYIDNI